MVWIRSADIYSVVHNNGIPLVVQPGMQGLRVYRVQVRTVKFLGFPVGLPQNMTPVALSKQKPEEAIVCSLVVTCCGCQNYGPFWDPYKDTAPNIWGTQKGMIILTTTHIRIRTMESKGSRSSGCTRQGYGLSAQGKPRPNTGSRTKTLNL